MPLLTGLYICCRPKNTLKLLAKNRFYYSRRRSNPFTWQYKLYAPSSRSRHHPRRKESLGDRLSWLALITREVVPCATHPRNLAIKWSWILDYTNNVAGDKHLKPRSRAVNLPNHTERLCTRGCSGRFGELNFLLLRLNLKGRTGRMYGQKASGRGNLWRKGGDMEGRHCGLRIGRRLKKKQMEKRTVVRSLCSCDFWLTR